MGRGCRLTCGIFVYAGWSIRLQLEINQNPKGAVLKLQDCVVLTSVVSSCFLYMVVKVDKSWKDDFKHNNYLKGLFLYQMNKHHFLINSFRSVSSQIPLKKRKQHFS